MGLLDNALPPQPPGKQFTVTYAGGKQEPAVLAGEAVAVVLPPTYGLQTTHFVPDRQKCQLSFHHVERVDNMFNPSSVSADAFH